jgi:hypothetical protein
LAPRRTANVALDESVLRLDRAAHRIDDPARLDDRAVAAALGDAAIMGGDCQVDEVAAQAPQPPERAILLGASEPTVADDIGDEDRCELSALGQLCSQDSAKSTATSSATPQKVIQARRPKAD